MNQPDSRSEPPVYDLAPLLSALGGDQDLLKGLLNTFLRDTQRRIDCLGPMIASGEASTIRLHAHSIKGSALNLRAAQLTAAAFDLERLAAGEYLDGASILFSRIKEEFGKVRDGLRKEGAAGE